jgi:uncharacterized membrane protein
MSSLRFSSNRRMSGGQRVGLAFVFLYFLIGGACHFLTMPFFVQIVPPYIPFPLAAVIVSGAFELLGAFGLLFKRTRYAAGIGLSLLTIAVTPANVFMFQHAELFPSIPPIALLIRLPLQLVLIACILWSTRKR